MSSDVPKKLKSVFKLPGRPIQESLPENITQIWKYVTSIKSIPVREAVESFIRKHTKTQCIKNQNTDILNYQTQTPLLSTIRIVRVVIEHVIGSLKSCTVKSVLESEPMLGIEDIKRSVSEGGVALSEFGIRQYPADGVLCLETRLYDEFVVAIDNSGNESSPICSDATKIHEHPVRYSTVSRRCESCGSSDPSQYVCIPHGEWCYCACYHCFIHVHGNVYKSVRVCGSGIVFSGDKPTEQGKKKKKKITGVANHKKRKVVPKPDTDEQTEGKKKKKNNEKLDVTNVDSEEDDSVVTDIATNALLGLSAIPLPTPATIFASDISTPDATVSRKAARKPLRTSIEPIKDSIVTDVADEFFAMQSEIATTFLTEVQKRYTNEDAKTKSKIHLLTLEVYKLKEKLKNSEDECTKQLSQLDTASRYSEVQGVKIDKLETTCDVLRNENARLVLRLNEFGQSSEFRTSGSVMMNSA